MADNNTMWEDVQAYVSGRTQELLRIEHEAAGGAPGGTRSQLLLAKYPLPVLVAAVDAAVRDGDEERTELGGRAFELLLGVPEVVAALAETGALPKYVCDGLASGAVPVRRALAAFASRLARGETGGSAAAQARAATLFAQPVVSALAASLADEDVQVAERVADAFAGMCGEVDASPGAARQRRLRGLVSSTPATAPPPPTPDQLSSVVGALAQAEGNARDDSVVQMRVFALAARIAGTGNEQMKVVSEAGLLSALLDTVASDDVLMQLNVLELLPPIARSARGLSVITSNTTGGSGDGDGGSGVSVWDRLLEWAGVSSGEGGDDPVPDAILGPAALSAAADVYAAAAGQRLPGPAAVSSAVRRLRSQLVPGLLRAVRRACAAAYSDTPAALMAIGALATAAAADRALVVAAGEQPMLLREWLECGVATDAQLRTAAYAGLARILDGAAVAASSATAAYEGVPAPNSPPGRDALLEPYKALFNALGEACGRRDTMEVLLDALKKPIAEPRFAAFDLLASVTSLPGEWGLRRVWAAPGAASYLLDREAEPEARAYGTPDGNALLKSAREWRFAVVHASATHPHVAAALGPHLEGLLREQLRHGPYWIPPAPAGVTAASQPA